MASSSPPAVSLALGPPQPPVKHKRKCYSREQKLRAIKFYKECGRNLYKTCQHFDINSKNLLRWLSSEKTIRKSKIGSRRVKYNRNGKYPQMEQKLHEEFRELRRRGVRVKGWWFITRAKQLMADEADSSFKFSKGWFNRFKRRYKISLRRPTNIAQRPPSDKEESIRIFHQKIRQAQQPNNDSDGPQEDRFKLSQISNVDQTPLPFAFNHGPTYETRNSSTVWVSGTSSGLDKRQCTVQLTIFADGKSRVKPLIIFRGKGKQIPLRERVQYDKRVTVTFQSNAWCDESIMEQWITNSWKPNIKEESLLVLDVHKAQKTDNIKLLLHQCNTVPIFVPAGCTGIVQPLDVCINAPFKKKIDAVATQHVNDNLEKYLHGKFTAGERRVLLTKWVGQAWEELAQDEDAIVRSFKKCGISVASDGSEDFLINLKDIENYTVNGGISDSDDDPFSGLSSEEESEGGQDAESEDEDGAESEDEVENEIENEDGQVVESEDEVENEIENEDGQVGENEDKEVEDGQ